MAKGDTRRLFGLRLWWVAIIALASSMIVAVAGDYAYKLIVLVAAPAYEAKTQPTITAIPAPAP